MLWIGQAHLPGEPPFVERVLSAVLALAPPDQEIRTAVQAPFRQKRRGDTPVEEPEHRRFTGQGVQNLLPALRTGDLQGRDGPVAVRYLEQLTVCM